MVTQYTGRRDYMKGVFPSEGMGLFWGKAVELCFTVFIARRGIPAAGSRIPTQEEHVEALAKMKAELVSAFDKYAAAVKRSHNTSSRGHIQSRRASSERAAEKDGTGVRIIFGISAAAVAAVLVGLALLSLYLYRAEVQKHRHILAEMAERAKAAQVGVKRG